ncbi:MAG: hypothetical protein Q9211_006345, partial [Gyalolechia sp. 1 TL-2023]
MPTKVRERDGERTKVRERNRDGDTDVARPKDRTRRKSTRSVPKSSSKDAEYSPTRPERSATITTPPNIRKTSIPKPTLERRSSSNPATSSASKASLPYPSFSKAHSKEAVGSREDILNKRQSYYTPDPTDLAKSNDEPIERDTPVNAGAAPPSPPLTTDPVPPVRIERDVSPHGAKTPTRKAGRKRSDLQKAAEELKRRLRRGGSITSERDGKTGPPSSGSRNAHRGAGKDEERNPQSYRRSKPSTPSRSNPKAATVEEDTASTNSLRKSASPPPSTLNIAQSQTESTTDSDATSIAPHQLSTQQPTSQLDTVSTISDDR